MPKYQIVCDVDGQHIVDVYDETNVVDALEFRGHILTGFNKKKSCREELRGEPKFSGLLGPMWGGVHDGVPVIRYEEPAVYASFD